MSMNKELDKAKAELERALLSIKEVNEKRNRIEGQYEASLESLKRLGYEGIPDATKDYKATMATLEADVETILKDVKEFMDEFDKVFAEVLHNG